MLAPGFAQRPRRERLGLALNRSIKKGNKLVDDGYSFAFGRGISCEQWLGLNAQRRIYTERDFKLALADRHSLLPAQVLELRVAPKISLDGGV
jgi:hypothetical protein